MTPEEIKKIAVEYAKMHVGRADCLSDEEFNLVMSRWVADVSKAYEFLTARYYLVEKGKVIAKYNEVKKLNTICDDMFADDTAVFEYLFGPDIRKEEE